MKNLVYKAKVSAIISLFLSIIFLAIALFITGTGKTVCFVLFGILAAIFVGCLIYGFIMPIFKNKNNNTEK